MREFNGWRPRNIFLFLGAAGEGKSTLTRTLVIDALANVPKGKKVLVYLSEESVDDFIIELNKSGVFEHGKELLTKLEIFSEQSIEDATPKKVFAKFCELCSRKDIAIVFLDNLTTSEFYMDKKVEAQSMVAKKLKQLALNPDKTIAVIAHTGTEVNQTIKRLVNANDIRGSKSLINITQVIFILQRFEIQDRIYQTLRLVKYRGYSPENKMFNLNFDKRLFVFNNNRAIDFETFKSAYGERNKL